MGAATPFSSFMFYWFCTFILLHILASNPFPCLLFVVQFVENSIVFSLWWELQTVSFPSVALSPQQKNHSISQSIMHPHPQTSRVSSLIHDSGQHFGVGGSRMSASWGTTLHYDVRFFAEGGRAMGNFLRFYYFFTYFVSFNFIYSIYLLSFFSLALFLSLLRSFFFM